VPSGPSRAVSAPLEAFTLLLTEALGACGSCDRSFTLYAAAAAEERAPLTLLPPQVLLHVTDTSRQRAERMLADSAHLLGLSRACADDLQVCAFLPESQFAYSCLSMVRHIILANEASLEVLSAQQVDALSAPDRAHLCDVRTAITPMHRLALSVQAELEILNRQALPRAVLLQAAAQVCAAVAELHVTVARRCQARAALSANRTNAPSVSHHVKMLVTEAVRLGSPYESPHFFAALLETVAG